MEEEKEYLRRQVQAEKEARVATEKRAAQAQQEALANLTKEATTALEAERRGRQASREELHEQLNAEKWRTKQLQ